VFTVLLGVLYPLAVTGAARLAIPGRAGGSLVRRGDQVMGSSLLCQQFPGPEWFTGVRMRATRRRVAHPTWAVQ